MAVNLAGVRVDAIGRGDVVAAEDADLEASWILDVALDLGGAEPPARVHVHHGTRETPARIVARDEGRWQLRCELGAEARGALAELRAAGRAVRLDQTTHGHRAALDDVRLASSRSPRPRTRSRSRACATSSRPRAGTRGCCSRRWMPSG
jgi:selenocysteine-specific translation elongation factor